MSRLFSCPIPENINPLNPNGFMFAIARIPEVSYFCQEAPLPGVSLGAATVPTPFYDYPVPGEKVDYEDLTIEFLVDADMKNYKAIFNWMVGLGFPESNDQYIEQLRNMQFNSEASAVLSDATLSILGPNGSPIQMAQFKDVFPVSLSALRFTSTSTDVQYLTASATFKYTGYTFI